TPAARLMEGDGFSQGVLLDAGNPRLDRGDSSFDQRRRLIAHFIWQIPGFRSGSALARHATAGWQVSGIVSAQTGQPFDVYDDGQADREIVTFRPRVTGPLPRVLGPDEMPRDPVTPNRFLYLPANPIRPWGGCIWFVGPFQCVQSVSDPLNDILP